MKKLRWGILAAGGIADRRTIPGLMQADNAELTAVMEVNMDFAESIRAKYGAKRAYDSEETLLADPEVDAVYIASPVWLHASQARLAADAGKHILLEKPLALNVQEAEQIVEHCRARGVQIAAGFAMRFGSYVNAMKEAISARKIGDVVSCYAHFTCWYPDMENAWRQSKATSGGGALMDMGMHCIDLIQYVTGSPVKQVAAFDDTQTFRYEVEDSSMVMMRLQSGAHCVVQSNFNIPDDAAKWRLEVFGTRGRLLGDGVIGQTDGGSVDAMFLQDVSGYDAQQDDRRAKSTTLHIVPGNLYCREIESFSDSILNGNPLAVPASEAVQIQRIVEAAYRSNREGVFVNLI